MFCQSCGKEFEVVLGRGSHRRVMCYSCQPVGGDRKTTYRNKHLKRQYGITQFDFLNMFESQGGKCKICDSEIEHSKETLSRGSKRSPKEACVDHCHVTNKIRGLLCFHCNTAIGHAFDNPDLLQKMINYLKQ